MLLWLSLEAVRRIVVVVVETAMSFCFRFCAAAAIDSLKLEVKRRVMLRQLFSVLLVDIREVAAR